jgi:hypothetical protein
LLVAATTTLAVVPAWTPALIVTPSAYSGEA